MPAVRWSGADGACAIATLQGAQLVSWVLPSGEECLYVSERSAYEAGRAIRGGIPVCFPQFADRGPLAQHGFARTLDWSHVADAQGDGEGGARFVLESTPRTRSLWPHDFRIELIATIGGPRLEVRLRVSNVGEDAFTFTAALHTYLRVWNLVEARVHGLKGLRYLTRGESATQIETREAVTAIEPVDRVYFAAPRETRLEDTGRALRIGQQGFTDTVVWNPGAVRTAQMADMPPEGYRRMLCVEAAAVDPPVVLAPGADWTGVQWLEALPAPV